ncbi:hypothetical protein D3C87_1780800 [compost metagenome]
MEHRHRRKDNVIANVAERVGNEAAQPDEIRVAQCAKLGATRGARGMHIARDLRAVAGQPRQERIALDWHV